MKKIKVKASWDPLSKASVEAQNAGMSYGQYMAARREAALRGGIVVPPIRPAKEPGSKSCRYCGGVVPEGGKNGDFCCRDCEIKWERNQAAAIARGAVSADSPNNLLCRHCGKPLYGRRKLYCDSRCQYLHKQEEVMAQRERLERKRCKVCGSPILDIGRRAYCSDQCKQLGQSKEWKAKMKKQETEEN